MQKRGVALVTVLFFMLVAIIAATALFKWLKYMGESSAAELKRTEAYQASQAGVETVRAWLQYDANDVGAILGYYLSENVPVRMDSVLAPLQSNKSQKFSVYLIAADVQSYPYKLKFVSTGTGRNGSRYSQVAIFDLNGLFRVYQPSESNRIDFTQAFFGTVASLTSSDVLSSAIINANGTVGGNTPQITNSLLVVGNVAWQGGTVTGKDFYITGTFTSEGNMNISGNAYFGNRVNVPPGGLTVGGTAFFNGDVVCDRGDIDIGGNATLKGNMYTSLSAHNVKIAGNLIVDSSGTVTFTYPEGHYFSIGRNAWSVNEFSGTTGAALKKVTYGSSYVHYITTIGKETNVRFGDSSTMSDPTELWVPNMEKLSLTYASPYTNYSGYYSKSKEGSKTNVGSWWYGYQFDWVETYDSLRLITKSTYKGQPTDRPMFKGADSLNEYRKLISDSTSCSSAGTVPDPLLLKDSTSWLAKANPASCNIPQASSNEYVSTFVSSMNDCYEKLVNENSDELYNGFLVYRTTLGQDKQPAGTLDGKFIIVIDASITSSALAIPPTTSSSVVMLYLPNGVNEIKGAQADASSAVYNYFIYSNGDINQIYGITGTIQGSIFMANCHKLGQMQGGIKAAYSATVVQGIADAGIVKQNPKYGSNSSSDTTETDTTAGYDSYYVSTSPRLKVALESEYANADIDVDTLTASNSKQSIPASVVVLPRIIYLPSSTEIKSPLSSFYSTMRMNDGTHATVDGSASCESVPTSGAIGTLASGVYACTFTPSGSGYNSCKFWVVASENSTMTSTTSSASAALSSSATTLVSSSSVPDTSGSSSSVSSSSAEVSSSDAYTVTNCYFGTTPVTVGGSTVFYGTLNGVSSLNSVTLRATGATDESWSSVTTAIAHAMVNVPTTAGIYSYQLLYNGKELCTANLTVINATGCSCTCSSGCGSLNGAAPTANKVGCWFVKSIDWINSSDGVYVNGTLYTGWQGNGFANNITKIDGGYYLESKSTNYSDYKVTAGTPTCTMESSSSSAAASSSGAASSTNVQLVHGGAYYDFVPGTTYYITCSSGSFICSADGAGKSVYVAGTLAFSSLSWQTLGNYQAVKACSDISGKAVTITGGTMRCMNDW